MAFGSAWMAPGGCGVLNYGKVYLHTYGPLREVQQGIARYPTFYNQVMPHHALESHTLEDVYDEHQSTLHATE